MLTGTSQRGNGSTRRTRPSAGNDGAAVADASLVWAVDHRGRWRKVPDPSPTASGSRAEVEEGMQRAGWSALLLDDARASSWGFDLFAALNGERFLCVVWLND